MKGKESLAAANRRTHAAREEIEQLHAELKVARDQQVALRDEIGRLKSDHFKEAQSIAAREVKRQLKKVEDERKNRGLSDALTIHLTYQKDKLIRNACRYISMTTGKDPITALTMVMTWCTDKDWTGLGSRAEWFIELGVPLDGWVQRQIVHDKHWSKASTMKASAISLDRAEREGHPDIHPKYNPKWYPQVDYEGIELIGDDEQLIDAAITPAMLAKYASQETAE